MICATPTPPTCWPRAVGIKIVSERLGHASVAFTLDVYGHVMPGQQASAGSRGGRLSRLSGLVAAW